MGSDNSKTQPKKPKVANPKSILKKPPVQGSVYSDYDPATFVPPQSNVPMYVEKYPVVHNADYLQREFYPPTRVTHENVRHLNDMMGQSTREPPPAHHHRRHHGTHTHHQHSSRRHHHHHHQPQRDIPFPVPPPPVHKHARRPVEPAPPIQDPSPSPSEGSRTPSPTMLASPTPPVKQKTVPPPASTTSANLEPAPAMESNYVSKSTEDLATMVIARRKSSRFNTPGNRWYDKNYEKRVRPLLIEYP